MGIFKRLFGVKPIDVTLLKINENLSIETCKELELSLKDVGVNVYFIKAANGIALALTRSTISAVDLAGIKNQYLLKELGSMEMQYHA